MISLSQGKTNTLYRMQVNHTEWNNCIFVLLEKDINSYVLDIIDTVCDVNSAYSDIGLGVQNVDYNSDIGNSKIIPIGKIEDYPEYCL